MPKPAARKRLTERSIASLKPGYRPGPPGGKDIKAARYTVFDAIVPSFAVRVTESGHKSFVVITTHAKGEQRWITLGTVGNTTLADARKRARELLALAESGVDPTAKVEAPPTYADIVARFIAEYAKPRNRRWHDAERILTKYPAGWLSRPIADIAKHEVRELLETVARDHGPVMSNRVLSAVRKLFAWALERDIIKLSPAAGVRPVAREVSRDRVLSDAELRAFWRATGAMAYPWGAYYRMLALTGQRLSEVARMRWQDIEGAMWTLPREATKTDQRHEVPLSGPALAILQELPRGVGPFVFSTGDGTKAIRDLSGPHERLEQAMPGEHWTPHDLRRTFASVAARLGTLPHVVEKVLNHSGGTIRGVAAIYNRYGYDAEKRAALDAWGAFLTSRQTWCCWLLHKGLRFAALPTMLTPEEST